MSRTVICFLFNILLMSFDSSDAAFTCNVAFLGDFIVYLINLTVISAISQNQYAIYKSLL